MARKKKAVDEETLADDAISAAIIKKFGNVVVSAEDFAANDRIVIPMSPSFDLALGGGVPEGATVILAGLEKCGKTMASLCLAANGQKPQYGGRNVYYLNIENRLKQRDLNSTKGLDLSKFHVVGSRPAERDDDGAIVRDKDSKILNATEYLEIGEVYLRDDPGCILIVDSMSAFASEAEMSGSMADQQRAETAKLIPKFFRRNSAIIQINRCIVVVICQMMENQNPKGKKYIAKGGMGVRYAADVNVQCAYFYEWEEPGKSKPVGQKAEWRVVTASLDGGIPGTKFTSCLRYGIGLDRVAELFELGVELGLITGTGWMVCSFMENHLDLLGVSKWDEAAEKMCKAQGAAKMYALLSEKTEWADALEADIKELLK
jgi:RecA/RadA recombinase